MKEKYTTIIEYVPEEGDKFYFYGGVNGRYTESVLGPIREVVEEYQVYELQSLSCHYHNDGCADDDPNHQIIKVKRLYAQVFGGSDRYHKEIRCDKLEWKGGKWFAGYLY